MFTVLLRKASGAGYYAMSGLPYDPIVQLSTCYSRLSVMEGRTLAIAAFNTKLDDDFQIMATDPAERAKIEAGMRETEARIERDMDPFVAARQMDTDEIVELGELRAYLAALVEMTLPEHRLSPDQEPADLVDARSARARRRPAMIALLAATRCSRAGARLVSPHGRSRDHLVAPGDVHRRARGPRRACTTSSRRASAARRRCPPDPKLARQPVAYGDVLRPSTSRRGRMPARSPRRPHAPPTGLVFRAPTSGRFYGRPGARQAGVRQGRRRARARVPRCACSRS